MTMPLSETVCCPLGGT